MSTEKNVTPAQELRAAASKIRDAAHYATKGPWSVGKRIDDETGDRSRLPIVAETEVENDEGEVVKADTWPAVVEYHHGYFQFPHGEAVADATHIALWHPGVAELVAVVLDNVARTADFTQGPNGSQPPMTRSALDLARAINGGAR